jgi:hypothetical protein
MKLLFSLEAISIMLVESYKIQQNLETGGILIGPKKHTGIITDVIPSTSYAERATASFYQSPRDVKILNQKLKEFQANNQDFKGYFHKHPSGLFNLSFGDKVSCKEILQSPNYKINNFLIMCIVTESHVQDFPIFSYVTSLNQQKQVIVEKTKIQVLPKSCILECAECFEPQVIGENHESHIVGHDSKGIEEQKSNSVVRNSEQGINNRQLPGVETRA